MPNPLPSNGPQNPRVDPTGFGSLSRRERQVISLATRGYLDKEIGHQLGLSTNTLRTYWTRIRAKVGDAPRAALAAAYVVSAAAPSEVSDDQQKGVYVIDPGSMTLLASDAINNVHGLTTGVPHPVGEYLKNVHPADRSAIMQVLEDATQSTAGQFHLYYRLRLPQGHRLNSVHIVVQRDRYGRALQFIGDWVSSVDCRKGLKCSVEIGLWTLDMASGAFWADDTCLRVFRVPKGSRRDFDAFLGRMTQRDRRRIRSEVGRGARKPRTKFQHDYQLRFENGDRITVRMGFLTVQRVENKMCVLGLIARAS